MLNLDDINDTITRLELGDTTFDNCIKLAALYTVRENYNPKSNVIAYDKEDVAKELSDILPQYRMYCTVKRKYQSRELTKEAVIESISDVCKEITEFVETLNSCSDMPEEREQIRIMIYNLNKKFSK